MATTKTLIIVFVMEIKTLLPKKRKIGDISSARRYPSKFQAFGSAKEFKISLLDLKEEKMTQTKGPTQSTAVISKNTP